MVRKFRMAIMAELSFLKGFLFEPFIKSFVLFTCILVCLLACLFNDVYICDAAIDNVYGIHGLLEDKSCKVGRERQALDAPSEISCLYHCSGQLLNIGIAYNSDSGACKCCSEITEPEELTTEGKKFYTISHSKDKPRDCGALDPKGIFQSGVYTVYPNGQTAAEVFCDFDDSDGPWTVIQRRVDGTIDFYRSYKAYQDGFGNLSGNFWLGLDTISSLTLHSGKTYSLKVILIDRKKGEKFANYSQFAVMNSSTGYVLNVQGYSGTAGDSFTHNHGIGFTTYDMDRDTWKGNTAKTHRGAWWFKRVFTSCLNGEYGDDRYNNGIMWFMTTGSYRSATFATMKLKANN